MGNIETQYTFLIKPVNRKAGESGFFQCFGSIPGRVASISEYMPERTGQLLYFSGCRTLLGTYVLDEDKASARFEYPLDLINSHLL